jgi:hypothetical protein
LSARYLAVELGVTKQGGTLALVAHLGRLALGEQLVLANPAAPTRDVEWHDNAVTDLDLRDIGADRLNDAHWLVPEDVALIHERPRHFVEM